MKLLILFALAAVAVAKWTPKTSEELGKIQDNCLNEYKLSPEMQKKLKNFEYSDDEKVKKFVWCSIKGAELFDDVNGWNRERFIIRWEKQIDKAELEAAMDKCFDKNEQKSKPEEWAARTWGCVYETKHKPIFKESLKW